MNEIKIHNLASSILANHYADELESRDAILRTLRRNAFDNLPEYLELDICDLINDDSINELIDECDPETETFIFTYAHEIAHEIARIAYIDID